MSSASQQSLTSRYSYNRSLLQDDRRVNIVTGFFILQHEKLVEAARELVMASSALIFPSRR